MVHGGLGMTFRSRGFATGLLATALTLTAGLPAWAQGADTLTTFANECSGCHGSAGEGGMGPNFRGNPFLADKEHVIVQILGGGGEMQGFGDVLSDQQIADLATYIRSTWGNAFGPVTAEEVAAQRK